jgi:8-oxo-dGTP pyrophosphatase MutT (NUDIX family)
VTSDPRAALLAADLRDLVAADDTEEEDRLATIGVLESLARPFDQDVQPEHVTASGFVLSREGVVLLRHRLMGIWVQPGGHVEPGEAPADAAAREVLEETGLVVRHLVAPLLVHVNVHDGPRSHRHYDCRWLLVAPTTVLEPAAGESTEVSWCLPEAALERCEPGLQGALAKVFAIARRLGLAEVASWPA